MNRFFFTTLFIACFPALTIAAEITQATDTDSVIKPTAVQTQQSSSEKKENPTAQTPKPETQKKEAPAVQSEKSKAPNKQAPIAQTAKATHKETPIAQTPKAKVPSKETTTTQTSKPVAPTNKQQSPTDSKQKNKTAANLCMPYIGEHLSFDIGWEFINAGSTTLDINSTESGWQVQTFARTNSFLDAFRKVRDHITAEGLCVNNKMQSTLFDADLHERKYKAQKRTEYLWQENKVTHTQNQITEYFDVPAGHLSVIDAFLAVRGLTLKPGQTVNIPVFDSRKQYEIEVNVLPKKETLKAPWGKRVSCILVKPKLKTAGIFASKGEMLLWMTDDEHHIPIKMKAKIKYGSIYAKLTAYSKDSPAALLAKSDPKTAEPNNASSTQSK